MTRCLILFVALSALSPHRASAQSEWTATHYGSSYNGSPLGCGGTYWSGDASIAAVGPSRYATLPCGARLAIEGPAGSIVVTRQDSCPGCSHRVIDLSEAAIEAVCGPPAHTCSVLVSVP